MVVVVILGILAALIVPNLMDKPDEARKVAARTDINSIGNALELYRLAHYQYPTTDQGLEALVTQPTRQPIPQDYPPAGYLQRLPMDPWGNPYQYMSPGQRGDYDLYSLGADGRPGGEGVAADIGNWDPAGN